MSHIEISKELEKINFKELKKHFPELRTRKKAISKITKLKEIRKWFWRKRVNPIKKKEDNDPKTQIESFQRAMKLLLITGQCLGLNPVAGITETDVSKMRFSILSWRFVFCTLIGIVQAIGTVLTIHRATKHTLTVSIMGYIIFYLATCVTTFLFLHMGTKWPALMQKLVDSSLNEYIDPSIKFKCYASCVITFTCAVVEHALSLISKMTVLSNCSDDDLSGTYYKYQRLTFASLYEIGVPFSEPVAIFLQIFNIISTLSWNYSDVYIVCISFYLVSVLEKINKKIMSVSEKNFIPPANWRSLREDYCEATQLVRSFDDVISGVILTSFSSNLCFICLQLFNNIVHGISSNHVFDRNCKRFESGIFLGYEYTIYVVFSASYLLARSLAMSLIAACVHSASTNTARALYNVPSSSYCSEVARFLDQVHAHPVALTGSQFFSVTRELVLSVAGTIVTYELVVLQVSGDGESSRELVVGGF